VECEAGKILDLVPDQAVPSGGGFLVTPPGAHLVKTREWQVHEAIELSFAKARLRTLDNLAEFAPQRIALHSHCWEPSRRERPTKRDLPYRQNGVHAGLSLGGSVTFSRQTASMACLFSRSRKLRKRGFLDQNEKGHLTPASRGFSPGLAPTTLPTGRWWKAHLTQSS
jgi:hypothetical protein